MTTVYSQNGYKANDPSLIASYTIARDVKINLRKGDVSVVLLHFARWYDKNIEPLIKEDTGGYNPRTIEGSKVLSNHASGTAEDLRWNKHARGKKNTFTAEQKTKIHNQLKFYEGVIRWGEDYQSATVDGMHYEINEGPAEVARIAQKCKVADAPKPPAPAKPASVHVVKEGDTGQEVVHIQDFFKKNFAAYRHSVSVKPGLVISVDGHFGKQTTAWVKEFQERTHLTKDGEVGPKTLAKMREFRYRF